MWTVRSAKSSSNRRRTETAGNQQDRRELAAGCANLHCVLNWDAQVHKSKLSPILSRVETLQATSRPHLASLAIDASCDEALRNKRRSQYLQIQWTAVYKKERTSLPHSNSEIQGSYQVIQSRLCQHFVSTRRSRSGEIPVFWEITPCRLEKNSRLLRRSLLLPSWGN